MTEDPVRDSVRDKTRTEDESARPSVLVRILLLPVRAYRNLISPLFPPTCRFYPSCSAYAVEALTVHGALRGSALAVSRLLRCGPWHPGGLDPVPPAGTRRRDMRRTESPPSGFAPTESAETGSAETGSAQPGVARAAETPAEE